MAETFVRIADSAPGPAAGVSMRVREYRVTSTLWRRHSAHCKQRTLGRTALRCHCPLWGDGYVDLVRVFRKSLDTRSLEDAQTRLNGMIEAHIRSVQPRPIAVEAIGAPSVDPSEEPESAPPAEVESIDPSLFANAAKAFLANCVTDGTKPPTIKKYRNTLNKLTAFAESPKVNKVRISDFEVTDLDAFRASRGIGKITSKKELETLRQFWQFCTVRGWCKVNIAKLVKGPRIKDQNDVVPYTKREMKAIVDACGTFGQYEYERKRARGMVVTLRNTALRISDIALMRKDRISRDEEGWYIFLRATKNDAPVFLPIPDEMVEALHALPIPRGADGDCPYFFWNGKSKPKSMISVAEETLSAVFRKSGVQDAGAHRYRHTLATELLGEGATFEEVADILGISPEVVREHYAKWSPRRQKRVNHLMRKVHGKEWRRESGVQ